MKSDLNGSTAKVQDSQHGRRVLQHTLQHYIIITLTTNNIYYIFMLQLSYITLHKVTRLQRVQKAAAGVVV